VPLQTFSAKHHQQHIKTHFHDRDVRPASDVVPQVPFVSIGC
jgi:hypothetical protein